MNISYNWLKKYVLLTIDPEETAKKLTSLGLEVETVETVQTIKGGLEGLVVAQVVECIDHPDSVKRLDGLNFSTIADDIVIAKSAKWLIENNYLAPYDYYAPKILVDCDKLTTTNGDYTQSDI